MLPDLSIDVVIQPRAGMLGAKIITHLFLAYDACIAGEYRRYHRGVAEQHYPLRELLSRFTELRCKLASIDANSEDIIGKTQRYLASTITIFGALDCIEANSRSI